MMDTSKTTPAEPVKVGIIVGAGTGKRLADIFEQFLAPLAERHGIAVRFLRNEEPYHSFQSLEAAAKGDEKLFKSISLAEVDRLENTVKAWHAEGVRAMFRTSINAETLYLFRQRVGAVKEFLLTAPNGNRILVVRDQAEGFYANTDYSTDAEAGRITFEGQFTRQHQQNVLRYAINRANQVFDRQPFEKWSIYKHHLFGDLMKQWAEEVDGAVVVYQPDNGTTKMNEFLYESPYEDKPAQNLMVVCSNEYGDIAYEMLLSLTGAESKLLLYSRNTYLSASFQGNFTDYQTAHGSADDRERSDDLLPYATLRVAAEIGEKRIGIPHLVSLMDRAVVIAQRQNLKKTSEILQSVSSTFNFKHL